MLENDNLYIEFNKKHILFEKGQKFTFSSSNEQNSIFPKNIFINAIVGKNGSGKTNLIKSIVDYNNNTDKRLLERVSKCLPYSSNINKDEILTLAYSQDNNTKLQEHSRSIDKLAKDGNPYIIKNQLNNYYITVFSSYKEYINEDVGKHIPTHITLSHKQVENNLENIHEIDINYTTFSNYNGQTNKQKFSVLLNDLLEPKENGDISDYIYIQYFLYHISKSINDKNSLKIIKEPLKKIIDSEFVIDSFKNLIGEVEELNNLIKSIEEIKENEINHRIKIIKITKESSKKLHYLFTRIGMNFFNIKFFKREKKGDIYFENLSSGEQQLLLIFSKIFNIFYKNINEKEDLNYHYMLLFDEIETSFHPSWQKKIVKWVISFIESLSNKHPKIKFNLVFSTHSPFILSDIPKENVIFLENGKQVQGLDIKQTFGANIHTLLSDSFFMEDGLMGEFAKGKIEEIKKFYELAKSFKDNIKKNKKPYIYIKLIYLIKIKKFRHIQSIIGEPFLQTIIKNYLDELEQIFDNENFERKKLNQFIKDYGKDELKAYLDNLDG